MGGGEIGLVVVVHQLDGVEYTHSVNGIFIYIRCIHIYLNYQENIFWGGLSSLSISKQGFWGIFLWEGEGGNKQSSSIKYNLGQVFNE